MLNSEFDAFGGAGRDYYPRALRAEIDRVNAFVYEHVNNGVYRAGFAPPNRPTSRRFHIDRPEPFLIDRRKSAQ